MNAERVNGSLVPGFGTGHVPLESPAGAIDDFIVSADSVTLARPFDSLAPAGHAYSIAR